MENFNDTMTAGNVIAATTAIEAIKKHGDKAVDVLLAAVFTARNRI